MKYNRMFLLLPLTFALLVTAACGSVAAPPTVTNTSPPPTSTKRPTSTPRPTATPNVAATQAMQDALAKIQGYVDSGYLDTADGKLFPLEDYNREMAKKNFLDFDLTGYDGTAQDLAIWGDIKLESARPVSGYEYSGCGFSFRINPENYDGYTVHLTKDSILVSFCDSSAGYCRRLGKTTGTGKVNLSNPAEASMEVVVSGTKTNVLVDGKFIASYTLSKDKLLDPGYVVYSIISGTNADYGTRCEISNANLWVVQH